MSYLANLTFRLAAGAMRLPEDVRRRHAAFLTAAQNEDGGFSGRQGPSDPYYTGFALRGLALLGGLTETGASAAARFLQGRVGQEIRTVDFLSLVTSAVLLEMTFGIDVFAATGHDRKRIVADVLERLRGKDGGYAKNDRSPHSSTYHTFLAAACKQLVGLPIDDAPRIVDLIRSRQRGDGACPRQDSGPGHSALTDACRRAER